MKLNCVLFSMSDKNSYLFAINYNGHLEGLLLGVLECFLKGFSVWRTFRIMFLVLHGLAKGFNGLVQAYVILIFYFWDFVSSHGGHAGETEPVRSARKGGDISFANWPIGCFSKEHNSFCRH